MAIFFEALVDYIHIVFCFALSRKRYYWSSESSSKSSKLGGTNKVHFSQIPFPSRWNSEWWLHVCCGNFHLDGFPSTLRPWAFWSAFPAGLLSLILHQTSFLYKKSFQVIGWGIEDTSGRLSLWDCLSPVKPLSLSQVWVIHGYSCIQER